MLATLIPRLRYGIFAGTNTWHEWWIAFRALARMERPDQESVIRQYERAFADSADVKHAISFGAGRMALYAILEALNVGPDDEVIIPGYTCVVVPNAVIYRGAQPVYSDIELRTFNQIPAKIESLITPRTRAIVAQHTFGVPCDLDAIIRIGEYRSIGCGHIGALYRARWGIGYATTTDHAGIKHPLGRNVHEFEILPVVSGEFRKQAF